MVHPDPTAPPNAPLRRTAWLCALTPLTLGTLTFLLWNRTHAEILLLFGVLVILGGVLATVGCIGSLSLDWWRSRGRRHPSAAWSRLACVLVMAANYPVAAAMIEGADDALDLYPVTIQNLAPSPLLDLRLSSGVDQAGLGGLASGASQSFRVEIPVEGQLFLKARLGTEDLEFLLEGYAVPTMAPQRIHAVIRGVDDLDLLR